MPSPTVEADGSIEQVHDNDPALQKQMKHGELKSSYIDTGRKGIECPSRAMQTFSAKPRTKTWFDS
jgi:hypothetical protein